MLRYRLRPEPDDNGTVLVTSPDIPIVTYGVGETEALQNAVDAIHYDHRESDESAGTTSPMPLEGAGDDPLYGVPLQTELKIRLHQALKAADLTRADLVRRLGWDRESLDRLFRLAHQSKIEQIEQAFAALGKSVFIEVRDDSRSTSFERAA